MGKTLGSAFGWFVALLRQHSGIGRGPGHPCKQGSAPSPTPLFQGRCLGYCQSYVPLLTLYTVVLEQNLLTISLRKV